MTTRNRRKALVGATIATLVALGTALAPSAAHAHGQGDIPDVPYGFFYGTFDQSPNLVLLAGGTAEEFCLNNPSDPFNAEPGLAPIRTIERNNGTIVVKGKDHGQPIHMYEQAAPTGPDWLLGVCADLFDDDEATTAPAPMASGTAKLKVRDKISGDRIDVFNSVRGRAVASDGTVYRIRASADLVLVNGVPQSDPTDFVSLSVTGIARCR